MLCRVVYIWQVWVHSGLYNTVQSGLYLTSVGHSGLYHAVQSGIYQTSVVHSGLYLASVVHSGLYHTVQSSLYRTSVVHSGLYHYVHSSLYLTNVGAQWFTSDKWGAQWSLPGRPRCTPACRTCHSGKRRPPPSHTPGRLVELDSGDQSLVRDKIPEN